MKEYQYIINTKALRLFFVLCTVYNAVFSLSMQIYDRDIYNDTILSPNSKSQRVESNIRKFIEHFSSYCLYNDLFFSYSQSRSHK